MTFIYFNIIWIGIFYIDTITKKLAWRVFDIYIFDFTIHFYNTYYNIKLFLINVFALSDISPNKSKH